MHPSTPLPSGIEAVAWLAGRWVGEDGGDRLEEWWSEPHGGMMLGMFRWHRDGAPRFYELMSIEPQDGGLVFRIKHFDPGLIGWEEKGEAVTLDLVALEPDRATFLKRGEERWMVYRREASGDALECWFETQERPHVAGDEFRYGRA